MNNLDEIHSWSKRYRQEVLQEAQQWHLAERMREYRTYVRWRVGTAWRIVQTSLSLRESLSILALLVLLFVAAGCTDPQSSDGGPYTTNSYAENSTHESVTDTESSTSSSKDADLEPSTDSARVEQHEYTPVPSTPDVPDHTGLEGEYTGMRYTAGLSSSTSIECYSFYPDGNVELRHNGAYSPSDYGSYQAAASGWQIYWSSGRTSYVEPAEGGLQINDLTVKPIDTCLVSGAP